MLILIAAYVFAVPCLYLWLGSRGMRGQSYIAAGNLMFSFGLGLLAAGAALTWLIWKLFRPLWSEAMNHQTAASLFELLFWAVPFITPFFTVIPMFLLLCLLRAARRSLGRPFMPGASLYGLWSLCLFLGSIVYFPYLLHAISSFDCR